MDSISWFPSANPNGFAFSTRQANAHCVMQLQSWLHPCMWSDYSKEVGGQFTRICLKIAKKCGLCLDIFSCVKMKIFCSFFVFMLEMHDRCDNQYKTGANRENIFGQPMLFVCMGICVLSPAHESEMRGYLVYVLIVKYLSH